MELQRRSFLSALASLVGSRYLAGATEPLDAKPKRISPLSFEGFALDGTIRVGRMLAGFKETAKFSAPNDGFKLRENQIHMVYRRRGVQRPVHIYLAPEPAGPFFSTEEADPQLIPLTIDGALVEAEYWDGVWTFDPNGDRVDSLNNRLGWTTEDQHTLVWRTAAYAAAINGRRHYGLTLDAMKDIAQSVEITL